MKKILHITSIKELRGGDIQMLNVIKQFKNQKKFENIVLVRKNAVIISDLIKEKIPYYEAPRANNFDLRFVYKIIKLVKKLSIDIIHVHDSTALTFTLASSYFLPKRVMIIYTRKSNNIIKNKKLNHWKYNHKRISKIICVTKIIEKVMGNSIEDQSKLITIYDGISLKEQYAALPLESIYKKSNENEILIGTFASLTKAKDLFTFIDTAKKILIYYSNAHFLIFGDGELKDDLKKYSKEIGIENHIHFLGFVNHASQYLNYLNIYLITSIREGIPLSLFEAFYKKVPVVSTNVSSIPEIIVDGETGMLCEVKDSNSLASKTIQLLNNPELCKKITTNANNLIKEKFTLDIVYKNYYAFYKNLINN